MIINTLNFEILRKLRSFKRIDKLLYNHFNKQLAKSDNQFFNITKLFNCFINFLKKRVNKNVYQILYLEEKVSKIQFVHNHKGCSK